MTLRMGQLLQTASNAVNAQIERLLLLAGIAISVILFIQVMARYLGSSLSWSEEVGRYLLVAITFLGATVGYKRAHFIGLQGVGRKLGPLAERAIVRLLQLLTLACFCFVTWFGAIYTISAWGQSSTALQMPMSIPLFAIPLAGAVFVLHVLADMTRANAAP